MTRHRSGTTVLLTNDAGELARAIVLEHTDDSEAGDFQPEESLRVRVTVAHDPRLQQVPRILTLVRPLDGETWRARGVSLGAVMVGGVS